MLRNKEGRPIIGGPAPTADDATAVNVATGPDAPPSQHVLRRQKKRAKKKRRQQLSSLVATDAKEGDDRIELAAAAAAEPEPAAKRSLRAPSNGQGNGPISSAIPYSPNYRGSPADTLAWMLHPVAPETFFRDYWEKKPLLIRRKSRSYFDGLFSSQDFDRVVKENYIKYGINLDLARYENGERTTENLDGRVHNNTMWAMYEGGCSIRMLNPQTYQTPIWQLVSSLQEYFNAMVGCNTYLTPPGAQGFAPHYDDIEAFILQLEGKKRWRLYTNPSGERLPRTSSRALSAKYMIKHLFTASCGQPANTHTADNMAETDLDAPLLDVELSPGDMLYFPRGMVHQAVSTESEHSFHLTVSTYQLFDWAAYLGKLVPDALATAQREDDDFRTGLPLQALRHVGVQHQESEDSARGKFLATAKKLLSRLVDYANFDRAADDMAVEFLHATMPPYVHGDDARYWSRAAIPTGARSNGTMEQSASLTDWIRLVSPLCCRIVAETDDTVLLYHNVDNGKVWHAEEPQSIELPSEFAAALEMLVHAPDYIRVDKLPELDDSGKQDLATALYDAGVALKMSHAEMAEDD